MLRAHKAAQAAKRLAKGPLYLDQGFVFADEIGRPWKCQSQATLFRAIVKRAKLDPKVHPHTLRHTYASLALKAGVPITTLAATLGHDTKTLMDVATISRPRKTRQLKQCKQLLEAYSRMEKNCAHRRFLVVRDHYVTTANK